MSEITTLPELTPKKSKITNPKGNPKWFKGMQSPAIKPLGGFQNPQERAKTLTQEYTPEQIIDLAERVREGKKSGLTTPDAIIIVHLANIFKADGLERERLYDRTFGKVPERVLNLNINLDAAPEQLSETAHNLLDKLLD